MILSKRIINLITKDSCTKDWRLKTAVCLLAIGMSEDNVENALVGNLDRKKECYNVCQAENLPFDRVWSLLK